jgi:hypothetical protein
MNGKTAARQREFDPTCIALLLRRPKCVGVKFNQQPWSKLIDLDKIETSGESYASR